jgi:DNA-binding CsgD family transcriptional regulator
MSDDLRGKSLTPVERQIGLRAASGHRNDEIARELGIDEAVASAHLLRVFRKTGARSSEELAHHLAQSRKRRVETIEGEKR